MELHGAIRMHTIDLIRSHLGCDDVCPVVDVLNSIGSASIHCSRAQTEQMPTGWKIQGKLPGVISYLRAHREIRNCYRPFSAGGMPMDNGLGKFGRVIFWMRAIRSILFASWLVSE
jgi:hypothetical protein